MNAPTRTVLLFEIANDQALLTDPAEASAVFSAAGVGFNGTLISVTNQAPAGPALWGPAVFATGLLGGFPGGEQFLSPEGRHAGGSNFLLADGHVRWCQGAQVSAGWQAASETAAQTTAFRAGFAEGTGYSGAGAHLITFSPR